MKLQNKLLVFILALFLLVLISLHVFVSLAGKFILSVKLGDIFGREVKVESITTDPLFGLTLRGLQVGDLFSIEEAYAAGGLLDILKRDISLSSLCIKGLTVNFERPKKDTAFRAPPVVPPAIPGAAPGKKPLMFLPRDFFSGDFRLGHVEVQRGTINFKDSSMSSKEIRMCLKDFQATVDNLRPENTLVSFKFSGVIPWDSGGENGRLEVEGWLNPVKKDTETRIEIEGIDGISLHPYYAAWVDLEKAHIQKAKLKFSANIHGLNNNVTAYCQLELTDIVRSPRAQDEPQGKAAKLTDDILNALKSHDAGRIMLDFTVSTKMDKPEFGFHNIRSAFEDKLNKSREGGLTTEDVLMLPAKFLEVTIKSATGISKALIAGTFAVGNEIKKAVSETFKKEGSDKK